MNNWKGNLAPEVDITLKTRPTATSHRLMLHLGYWWLFILLHRPFYHRKARSGHGSEKNIDHVKVRSYHFFLHDDGLMSFVFVQAV